MKNANGRRKLGIMIDRTCLNIHSGDSVDTALDKTANDFGLSKDGSIYGYIKSLISYEYGLL